MATTKNSNERPYLGYGLGLRKEHYETVLNERPDVDWFEIVSENYMVDGGKPLDYLTRIREHYPMVMHGVSMSIGSTEPLNFDYLKQLKELITKKLTAAITRVRLIQMQEGDEDAHVDAIKKCEKEIHIYLDRLVKLNDTTV